MQASNADQFEKCLWVCASISSCFKGCEGNDIIPLSTLKCVEIEGCLIKSIMNVEG